MKRKIAIVNSNFHTTGISSVIMNYCLNINKNKFDLTIYAGDPINDEYVKKCIESGINFVKLPKKGFNFYKKLFFELKKNKYDVIHVHGSSATIFAEIFIGKLCGIPKRIAHSHNTTCQHPVIHKVFKPLLNIFATDRICCGKDAGKWMYGNYKFIVLNNGIVTDNFLFNYSYRDELRNKYSIKKNDIVIGHVGRLNEQKNQEYLIDLFNILSNEIKNLYLILIGDGPNKKRIDKMKKESKFTDNIILIGETSKPQYYYNVFDYFVMPSRYEGLPVVLVEAQSNGLKCIVSNNVTEEANITNKVTYFGLENKDDWINYIKSDIDNDSNRKKSDIDNYSNRKKSSIENINILKNNGFDISINVDVLEKIYDR